jgi:hypothetical protein
MAGKIQAPAVPVDQRHLKFSLEYIEPNHPRFSIANCTNEYFAALFKEIIRYQTFTVDAFRQQTPADHRHFIYFPDTREPNGFQNINPNQDEDLWTDSAWQFALPGQVGICTWRVHGFIDEEYFYIVWLDPNHQLD